MSGRGGRGRAVGVGLRSAEPKQAPDEAAIVCSDFPGRAALELSSPLADREGAGGCGWSEPEGCGGMWGFCCCFLKQRAPAAGRTAQAQPCSSAGRGAGAQPWHTPCVAPLMGGSAGAWLRLLAHPGVFWRTGRGCAWAAARTRAAGCVPVATHPNRLQARGALLAVPASPRLLTLASFAKPGLSKPLLQHPAVPSPCPCLCDSRAGWLGTQHPVLHHRGCCCILPPLQSQCLPPPSLSPL